MHYDFIEIGTSDYDTLIEKADDHTIGLSVECLKYYLDKLPNKKNVQKLNLAIGSSDADQDIDVYFIPEQSITQHQLPDHIRGCNSIGNYHKQHLLYKDLVEILKVKQISIAKLFSEYEVESVALLKLDTEGGDCDLLIQLAEYLCTRPITSWPKKIIFEANELTPKTKVDNTIELYCKHGYRLYQQDVNNVELVHMINTDNKVKPIVTHSDSRYLFGTKLLLQSILNNYVGDRLKFYVTYISTDISKNEIENFLQYFANEQVDIQFVTSPDLENFIATGGFDNYNKTFADYFSRSSIDPSLTPNSKCLCKMWIHDAVPEDEVIFIDSDTFFFGNIKHLFKHNRKRPILAAHDPWPVGYTMHSVPFESNNVGNTHFFHTDNIDLEYAPYFNTGVFVTSLEYWRQQEFHNKVKEYMKQYVILYGDQDILNGLLQDNFDVLPLHFNAQWKSLENNYGVIPYEIGRPYTPVIVHFNGKFKPMVGTWLYLVGDHPVLLSYYRLIRQTTIKEMYLSIFGREPDVEGWNNYIDSKLLLHQIQEILSNSEEAKQRAQQ